MEIIKTHETRFQPLPLFPNLLGKVRVAIYLPGHCGGCAT